MAINWNQLLQTINSGLQVGSQLLPKTSGATTSIGGLQIPNQLAGAGLLAGGLLSDKEPGQVTEARQFLRNRFTSPTALSEQFSGQIGGLMNQYQPLLAQQRQRGIEDISQRFAAAFPKTVGAQGPEFGTLARYITDEALPREQAVLGDIGRQLLTEQGNAATTILNTSKPDPLAQLAALMGYGLLNPAGTGMGGQGGTGQGAGQGTGQGVLNQLGGLLKSPTQLGQLNPFQLGQQLLSSGGLGELTNFIASGALGGSASGGIPWLLPNGTQALVGVDEAAQLMQAGIGQPASAGATQALGSSAAGLDFGLPGAGLLGPAGFGSAGAAVSAAGAALGGGAVGLKVGQALSDAFEKRNAGNTNSFTTGYLGGLGGGASGAAIGFAVGGPVGAVIGAIAGGIGGIFKGATAERRREDAQREQETAQTNAARPQALQNAQQLVAASQQAEAQFAPLRPQLTSAVSTMIQQGNPTVLSLLNQMRGLQQEAAGAQGMDAQSGLGSSVPRADIFGRTDNADRQAAQLVEFVMAGLGRGNAFTQGTPGADLLNSEEVGKFFPGANRVEKEIANLQTAQQWAAQLMQLAQQAGG